MCCDDVDCVQIKATTDTMVAPEQDRFVFDE